MGGYLSDEDRRAVRLAYATTAVAEHKTESHDAGGADLAVAAWPVGDPVEVVGANRTAIIHRGQPEGGDHAKRESERRLICVDRNQKR